MNSKMNIGIFGGTFDPPHMAHLIAAEQAAEAFDLDELLWVPAHIPPHKTDEIASVEHRFSMTILATSGNPKFTVTRMEMDRPPPSYSIETLREVKKKYRGASIYFFIGWDQFASFETWREYETILLECHVVVMVRPGADLTNSTLNDRVRLFSIPQLEISSTNIRERARVGKSIRYLVPDAVRDYIEEHRLYSMKRSGREI